MKQNTRLESLDLFRSIIIIIMILIHFWIYILKFRLSLLFGLLDFVVFGFIFLIGISITYHYQEKFHDSPLRETCFYFAKRALKIYFLYLTYALFICLIESKDVSVYSLLRIALFIDIAPDVTILISIIFFTIYTPLILLLLKHITTRFFALVGYAVYFLDLLLMRIQVPSKIESVWIIIIGQPGWSPFPILQWFCALSLGIYVGGLIKDQNERAILKNGRKIISLGMATFALFIIVAVYWMIQHYSLIQTDNKMPLTIYNLSYSTSISLLLFGFLNLKNDFLRKNRILELINLIGKNSLFVYAFHWLLIRIALFMNLANLISPIAICFLILTEVYLGAKINNSLKLI